jgi:hypothetical protein
MARTEQKIAHFAFTVTRLGFTDPTEYGEGLQGE